MKKTKPNLMLLFLLFIVILIGYFYTISTSNNKIQKNNNQSFSHNLHLKKAKPDLSSFQKQTNFNSNNKPRKPLFIDVFFNKLYSAYFSHYYSIKLTEYHDFCQQYGIDKSNRTNQDKYFKLRFLHELFTGTSANNCSYGGILKIPYFWHWISPNPRHSIYQLPNRVLLSKIKPPKRLAKYKSFADIDRIPYQFLSDLVSNKPRYYHSDCDKFFTFGWCSEREMSFCLLLAFYHYKGRILQQGIHVWSEFWIDLITTNNKIISLIAKVDNTFDTFIWKKAPNMKRKKWLNDIGNIKMVIWYNKKARDPQEKQLVQNLVVSNIAQSRIDNLVKQYLDKQK